MEILFIIVSVVAGYTLGMLYPLLKPKDDGSLVISSKDSRMIHQLEIDTEPKELSSKKRIVLKVRKTD